MEQITTEQWEKIDRALSPIRPKNLSAGLPASLENGLSPEYAHLFRHDDASNIPERALAEALQAARGAGQAGIIQACNAARGVLASVYQSAFEQQGYSIEDARSTAAERVRKAEDAIRTALGMRAEKPGALIRNSAIEPGLKGAALT